MANNSTGKWVQRAATTGGGRTYRGQMPVNWYATLVLICVVGLFLVGLSRYQLTHKSTSSAGPPTTSQTWYAGLGINVCGTFEPNLPASTNKAKTGLVADGNGVVTIAPKNSSESGSNATLGKFVSNYKGLELTNSTLRYPGKSTYTNGDVCPKGTPDCRQARRGDRLQLAELHRQEGRRDPGRPAEAPVPERAAHHHGLRAGQRHDPQAAVLGDHQPHHRRPGRSDDADHRDADHRADAPTPTTTPTAPTSPTTTKP